MDRVAIYFFSTVTPLRQYNMLYTMLQYMVFSDDLNHIIGIYYEKIYLLTIDFLY